MSSWVPPRLGHSVVLELWEKALMLITAISNVTATDCVSCCVIYGRLFYRLGLLANFILIDDTSRINDYHRNISPFSQTKAAVTVYVLGFEH